MTTAQRTALSVLTLLSVLAYSGAARADWKIDRAKAVAAKAWNDPCVGSVTVEVGPQAGADWLASTLPSQCRITLSDRQTWSWGRLCPVILHEYGHLAGYTDPTNPLDPHHSHNPRSIMYAFTHADRRCAGRGAAYLGLESQLSSRTPRPVSRACTSRLPIRNRTATRGTCRAGRTPRSPSRR